jgi:hypothetical protein
LPLSFFALLFFWQMALLVILWKSSGVVDCNGVKWLAECACYVCWLRVESVLVCLFKAANETTTRCTTPKRGKAGKAGLRQLQPSTKLARKKCAPYSLLEQILFPDQHSMTRNQNSMHACGICHVILFQSLRTGWTWWKLVRKVMGALVVFLFQSLKKLQHTAAFRCVTHYWNNFGPLTHKSCGENIA